MTIRLLSVSDKKYHLIHSPQVRERFDDMDFVIGCGDLPYYYLEHIAETLQVPLFYVRGNHNHVEEFSSAGVRTSPKGCIDLHGRNARWNRILMAGVEGSTRYNNRGSFQYTQSEMWGHVLGLVPGMLVNKLMHGRFLDVFISHAPPWGIHDKQNLTHQGIKAFRWLINVFSPSYHFHGHIHVYQVETQTETLVSNTNVINTYGFRETILDLTHRQINTGIDESLNT